MAVKGSKRGVQSPYTEEAVHLNLLRMKAAGMSLREIAEKEFNGLVTHGDIQRALNGEFPKSSHKRAAMGLPAYAPAPVCGECGQVHVVGECTQGKIVRVTVARPRVYRSLWEIPVRELRRRLDEREDI